MTRPESDAQFDWLLVAFLGWEAGQVTGAPSAEEMAGRMTAAVRVGTRRRRMPDRTVVELTSDMMLVRLPPRKCGGAVRGCT